MSVLRWNDEGNQRLRIKMKQKLKMRAKLVVAEPLHIAAYS